MQNAIRVCLQSRVALWGLLVGMCCGCGGSAGPLGTEGDPFGNIVSQIQERAAKKATAECQLTVTEPADEDESESGPNPIGRRTVRVRKECAADAEHSVPAKVTVYNAYFELVSGQWRCTKVTSHESAGDNSQSENSLEGPDIRLPNLLIWMDL
ncbi:MAG: hypothetical protein JSS02_24580 [Planctomycetes bacterium]|nr:hypothetical protein [Planctomycetota bacterium]